MWLLLFSKYYKFYCPILKKKCKDHTITLLLEHGNLLFQFSFSLTLGKKKNEFEFIELYYITIQNMSKKWAQNIE